MHLVCPHCLATNRVPAERLAQDPVCGRCAKALLPGRPVALDDAGLARLIERGEGLVVVDFWAAWCGPCRQMAPQFEAAAAQLARQALFVKVDSDACPEASARHGIRSIPTLIAFRGGHEVARLSGAMGAAQIVQWVRQHGA
ncbi:thioredoxin [Sphaerotilus hippei]|uniref:Thioredoxin n=1 Tax=Sphaerotilus hippei TaxID=744406 RepID=A0A318GYS5_9BURK|nr:thioredoxin TrxC [Sphaerotilus hippei]PXW93892.1 thioredoxin [Sphaerotilus hippei]